MSIELSKDKTYLVTGGSGFLGHELIKRLIDQGVKVRCLSRNEGNLIKLKQEYPSVDIFSGDIADAVVVAQACKGVDGIFHLAASKHVGLAETFTRECVNSNVIGTLNLLDYSLNHKLDFILGISTDKAAQISGVYGATKFLMERLFNQYARINESVAYRIVRYGNVMYSTGSVMCKWKDLMESGKVCTITSREATRFYWTVGQAVDLIFSCLRYAENSGPFCPSMKSMSIGDLYEAMNRKYGKIGREPNVIGLQPGENLHEIILPSAPSSDKCERYTIEEIMELV